MRKLTADGVASFADYWEDKYASCYDRWLRVCYLARLPPELHHRIPSGTQHGESSFGHIKRDDFAALCVPPSARAAFTWRRH